MSTVIIDTKKHIIYADTQGTKNGRLKVAVSKIAKVSNRRNLVGGVGSLADLYSVKSRLEGSKNYAIVGSILCPLKGLKLSPDSLVIVIGLGVGGAKYSSVKSVYEKTWYGSKSHKLVIENINHTNDHSWGHFIAIGSGSRYAKPVLHAMGSPRIAIKTASAFDLFTNNEVECIDFSTM